jgi:hypothetical protein
LTMMFQPNFCYLLLANMFQLTFPTYSVIFAYTPSWFFSVTCSSVCWSSHVACKFLGPHKVHYMVDVLSIVYEDLYMVWTLSLIVFVLAWTLQKKSRWHGYS